MPTGAVLILRLPKQPDWSDQNRWRGGILSNFDPNLFHSDGPLRLIRASDHWTLPISDESVWFDVGVSMEYYGDGYERGDLPELVRLAEWIEHTIAGAEVWYGHDAADESLALFGRTQRARMMDYFAAVGHRPYDAQFGRI